MFKRYIEARQKQASWQVAIDLQRYEYKKLTVSQVYDLLNEGKICR